MADKPTYLGVAGYVQFEPREREANNQTIRDIAVKPVGSTKLIRITLWPEFEHVPVEQGDFFTAEGKFDRGTFQDKDTGEQRESLQINANKVNVNGKRYDPQERGTTSSQDKDEDLF